MMTPEQKKLIDAAAKVHYERLKTWGDDNGLKLAAWEEISQEERERHYADMIGPVTVALEEAAKVADEATAFDDALQKSAGWLTTGQRIARNIRALMDKP